MAQLVKKYEPQTLSDIVGQKPVVDRMIKWAEQARNGEWKFPHLLFSGPPGVGKTSIATAFARDIYGDKIKYGFRRFNASDERGIKFVQEQVKTMAKSMPFAGLNLIFLDEFDGETPAAQDALRGIMEEYTKITRFILSCNYPYKIIEPLRSRCGHFRFSKVSEEDLKNLLRRVLKAESIKIQTDAAMQLINLAEGKPRNLLNLLDMAMIGSTPEQGITIEMVENVAPKSPEGKIAGIWELLKAGKRTEADIAVMRLIDIDTISPESIADGLFRTMFDDQSIKESSKTELARLFCTLNDQLTRTYNPEIPLRAMVWLSVDSLRKGDF